MTCANKPCTHNKGVEMFTILFTNKSLETTGIVIADVAGTIHRHAHEGRDYERAFVVTNNEFHEFPIGLGGVPTTVENAIQFIAAFHHAAFLLESDLDEQKAWLDSVGVCCDQQLQSAFLNLQPKFNLI